MPELLDLIFSDKSDSVFYRIKNPDGKQWLIPACCTKTAFQLYQPGSWKGKLLKRTFPLLKNWWFVQKILGIEREQYKLDQRFESLLKGWFPDVDLEFSVFCGTPSVHQKITLQLSSGDKILGYCKVSNTEEVIRLFFHEQQVLNELRQKGIDNIPRCLYCGPLNDEIYVFLQSTSKTSKSKIVHKWTSIHGNFLTQLFHKTKVLCSFAHSDLAKSLYTLETYLDQLPSVEAKILEKAILTVRSYYDNKTVEFSVYLSDFTPWNIYFENGVLYAFDFEYEKRCFPPFMDFFHFNSQVAILENNYSSTKTYEYCNSIYKTTQQQDNFNIQYLNYLLSIISFYFEVNHKPLDMNDRCYCRWFPLVKLIINEKHKQI